MCGRFLARCSLGRRFGPWDFLAVPGGSKIASEPDRERGDEAANEEAQEDSRSGERGVQSGRQS